VNDGIIICSQILKDDAAQEKYDYAIAHPKKVFGFSYAYIGKEARY
jgi:hypothetical protein